MENFTHQIKYPKPPGEVLAEILTVWTPRLKHYKFRLTSQSPGGVTYESKYRPVWTLILAVVLFPIGLLFLFHNRMIYLTFSFIETEGGTLVTIAGEADRSLSTWLGEAPDPAPSE
jgi:hypothetical protein